MNDDTAPGGQTQDPVGAPDASAQQPAIPRNKVWSWAAWDWGSAAFNAVATSFVFSVYLTGEGVFASAAVANQYLAVGMTIAGIVVAFLAPVTGRRADKAGKGLQSVALFTFLVVGSMAAMFFVAPESPMGAKNALILGVALLGLGNIFFEFASVNYNAMLNYVSTPENRGRVSGFGWGSAYLGGIVLLLILYFGFINPEVGLFGVTAANGLNVRVAMLFAALWMGLSSLPVLLNPPPGYAHAPAEGGAGTIWQNYKALFRLVVSLAKDSPDTLKFLIASAIFRDGLAGVFTFGGVIAGAVFGFSAGQVIIFAIVANVVAGVSTILSGRLDDLWGPKKLIVLSLVSMVIAAVGVFVFHKQGPIVFWILGLMLTIFVGPAQSASRSMLARMIPPGREGEVFGLYATTGRAVSFLAPMLYGIAITIGTAITGQDGTPFGILGVSVILLAGLLLLLPVKQGTTISVENLDG